MNPRWTMYTRPNHIRYSTMSVWPTWIYWGETFVAARQLYRSADTHKAKRKRKVGRRTWLRLMAESIVRYDREIEQ